MDKVVTEVMKSTGGVSVVESEEGNHDKKTPNSFLSAANLHDSLSVLGFKAWKDLEPGNTLK